MRSFAHIVNPVTADESSDLFRAQPVTFETMRIAKHFARDEVDVTQFCVGYPEDRALCPNDFESLPDLDRSIMDVYPSLSPWRKLPLLVDILDRLYERTAAEFMIYTNVDIALQPYFYRAMNYLIEEGYDAFVVNRRTITDKYHRLSDIPIMCAQAGESHPGHDCFVFRRDAYTHFNFGTVCIGVNWVGRVLLWNLLCHANRFREFKDLHATFHIGNDKVWKQERFASFKEHNKSEALKTLNYLGRKLGPLEGNELLLTYVEDVLQPGEYDFLYPENEEERVGLFKRLFRN